MLTLVLNTGSSSLRFALYDGSAPEPVTSGMAERLGTPGARLELDLPEQELEIDIPDELHEQALRLAISKLHEHKVLKQQPDAVGHRVVHGGEHFTAPALINDEALQIIESCNHLAPLHNPSGLLGIKVAQQIFPDTPQVAVFDTSFHQTLPEHAYLYAIPREFYSNHGVRRYGFHGSSHGYVAQAAADQLAFPIEQSRIISSHLGNGCSATAILNGKSVDTTMGLTPLEGLVMGTRSGDIDPGLLIFLGEQLNMSIQEISDLLNKQSGLLGLSGQSNDMRTCRKHADDGCHEAAMAVEIFCYRAAKSLAALTVATGGLDTLIFTGGIGENDFRTRARIMEHLQHLGLNIDPERNPNHGKNHRGVITCDDSPATAVVIPTREELMIARLTEQTLHG
ncbi:acetate kinase [Verrucomicrobiaceae bacterium N1E253]|uniref:Acetate kinase n=1 Tax=Oceaniferula marina TaxID=2748318 RepID=A0A851GNR1_9BACT|nr:acetate kinase [Oceaniferula marina]NWK56765.1 acetate kinase [Oceaniferula marina]